MCGSLAVEAGLTSCLDLCCGKPAKCGKPCRNNPDFLLTDRVSRHGRQAKRGNGFRPIFVGDSRT